MAGVDDLRGDEVDMLRAMYTEEELFFPKYPDPRYSSEFLFFVIKLSLEDANVSAGEPTALELGCTLPGGYPQTCASFSITCELIRRAQNDQMVGALQAAMGELEGQMQVLLAVDWVKDNFAHYIGQAATALKKSAAACPAGPKVLKGFMREWCSFVSLYKDSYISGPNRFEVMMSLARDRGLNITGMGISGKPGGLVAEGEENDMLEFMNLMRTEFFETLNPRGRKLTTRLQERWPLDSENDRFEVAEIMDRLRKDAYRSADRAEGRRFKAGEKERLEKQEAGDRARLNTWRAANGGRDMPDSEVDQLLSAGPPTKCSTKGVYLKCGCEDPPTMEEIDAQRLFKDFSIFQGKEGFEAAYQDAAKTFKELGRMDGFDAMFTYRFS